MFHKTSEPRQRTLSRGNKNREARVFGVNAFAVIILSFYFALQMLILTSVGLQIRPNG